jgi:hypothetical protein
MIVASDEFVCGLSGGSKADWGKVAVLRKVEFRLDPFTSLLQGYSLVSFLNPLSLFPGVLLTPALSP